MKIYDETTLEELENPDLLAGRVYNGVITTGEALEVLPGTVTADRPEGLRRRVTVTEPCRYYHRYYPAELEALKKAGSDS